MTVAGSGEVCDFVTEENFVFKLNDEMKNKISEWVTESNAVQPLSVRNKFMSDLADLNSEISISRPRSRLSWGIEVPEDPS